MARITKAPSYLYRSPYSYCFRIKVPKDLQSVMSKKELRTSLKTGYLGIAKSRARVLAVFSHELFSKVREALTLSELTDQDIIRLIKFCLPNHIVTLIELSITIPNTQDNSRGYLIGHSFSIAPPLKTLKKT